MISFKQFIIEQKKDDKENKIKFVETDPQEPFPEYIVDHLKKEISKLAKDLSINWNSPIELVNQAFNNLEVPIPKAYLKKRWDQYNELLGHAVNNLVETRGFSDWSIF